MVINSDALFWALLLYNMVLILSGVVAWKLSGKNIAITFIMIVLMQVFGTTILVGIVFR